MDTIKIGLQLQVKIVRITGNFEDSTCATDNIYRIAFGFKQIRQNDGMNSVYLERNQILEIKIRLYFLW
ncbi:unnamed protein product [Heterobilharzia americana]|nr:unnamed protein product [Heterobilharzia americana]CAH8542340.1 unnamed protein product [Heterobilharzia americana]